MPNGYQIFMSIILSAIGFMLVRFYFLFDEVRKDVKAMLINSASRDQAIRNINNDIAEIKRTTHEQEKRLRNVEIQVNQIKNKP
jgi:hypothetical protein